MANGQRENWEEAGRLLPVVCHPEARGMIFMSRFRFALEYDGHGGELPHFPSEPLATSVQERLSTMKGKVIGTWLRESK